MSVGKMKSLKHRIVGCLQTIKKVPPVTYIGVDIRIQVRMTIRNVLNRRTNYE